MNRDLKDDGEQMAKGTGNNIQHHQMLVREHGETGSLTH